jgi:predicted N-acetyltransferase YhbS
MATDMATIRDARRDDNAGLVALTAATPMGGAIAVRSDRGPDFFRLLERRGPSRVLVAEEGGVIVGCISANRVSVYVEGAPEDVYYLGDLKVRPDRRRSGIAAGLLKAMEADLRAAGADLVLCTAAFGNDRVRPYLEGRAGLPRTAALGVFKVLQLVPRRRADSNGAFEIGEEPEDPEMIELYNEHFREYQFGPVVGSWTLRGARHWVARAEGAIQAALSLVDVGDSRQNVIVRLSPLLSVLVPALRAARRVAPLPDLPRKGEPIRTLYIKALACRPGREPALDLLVQRARHQAFLEGYHFVTAGFHERDPQVDRLAIGFKFTFKSLGFVVGLRRSPGELEALTRKIPYEDYSLV